MRRLSRVFMMMLCVVLVSFLDTHSQDNPRKSPVEPASDSAGSPDSSTPLTIRQIRQNLPATSADRFEFLRKNRKITLEAIDSTAIQLKKANYQRDVELSKKADLEEQMMDLKPRYSKEKPIQDLKKAQKEEEAMEKRLEDAKSRIPPAPQGEIQRLQEELDDQREYIGQIQKAIDTDAERRSEEGKKLHDEKAAVFKSVSDEVNRLSEQTEKLPQIQLSYQRLLGEIDDLVNQLFIASDASNSFRLRMSVAFSILVGLVIVGFFIVAYTNDEVKKSIFSNESGIQFITLFCLVVAIILFGIINILEGKELSALLGGLSGYILGRGTPTK